MKRRIALLAVVCLAVFGMVGIAVAQDAKVAGNWDLTQPGRGGDPQTSSLVLTQDGQKLTGTLKGGRGDAPVTGTISGNKITLTVTRTGPNGEIKIDYTGTVTGDTMKGSVTMRGNAVDWSAKKSS